MPRTPKVAPDVQTDTSGKTPPFTKKSGNYRGRGKKSASAKSATRKTKSYRGK
jgi:hypothetical protein